MKKTILVLLALPGIASAQYVPNYGYAVPSYIPQPYIAQPLVALQPRNNLQQREDLRLQQQVIRNQMLQNQLLEKQLYLVYPGSDVGQIPVPSVGQTQPIEPFWLK